MILTLHLVHLNIHTHKHTVYSGMKMVHKSVKKVVLCMCKNKCNACTCIKIVGVHENERAGIQLGEIELETQKQLPEESDEEEDGLITEEQVHEALGNLSSANDIRVELRPCDTTEEGLLATFASVGCGCSKKCSSQFSLSYIQDMRAQCYELSHNELDLVLLGQLVASTNTSDMVVVDSGHLGKERKRIEHFIMQARLCAERLSAFCTQ